MRDKRKPKKKWGMLIHPGKKVKGKRKVRIQGEVPERARVM